MIRHCAFFRFKPEVTQSTISDLLNEFILLAPKMDGLIDIQVGQNVSPEGLDGGFSRGLFMDFTSSDARDRYLDHRDHLVLAERLMSDLLGGVNNGVVLFDMTIDMQPK